MEDNQEAITCDEFLYVTTGVIPEALANMAYRRSGHPDLAGRKLIKCPYCRELLTHIDRNASVKMYRIPKGGQKKQIPNVFLKRCNICKNEVGIAMVR